MGSPARQKRLGLSFFAVFKNGARTHLSGFVGLRGLSFCQNWIQVGLFIFVKIVKIGVKWVCFLVRFDDFAKKGLSVLTTCHF